MAAIAAGAPLTLPGRKPGWIYKPSWDLPLIIFSAVLVPLPFLMAWVAQATGLLTLDKTVDWINIVVALMIGGPHLFSTVTYTFMDGRFRSRHKAYLAMALLKSSGGAWGEKDLGNLEKGVSKDPTDTQGPLGLAVAVSSETPGKKTRIVVVGDSDLISDEFLQVGVGNLLFGLNAAHWLLQQESRIAIPPKTAVEAHLALTATQSNVLFVLFVLVFPAVVIAAGVFVYMRRRR